ncbi:WhiB family transcriptional regulator [Nocardia camponoti]|uniref:4Fe-4S Wbl-type domain-containing protein n=1 Tax=Nocardia camponoti TaxID=1616106 RepID=A0A917V898_9NOCA|nr:WhiB family transcriptional regulator [Nocardia camponoti]GGK48402.1 hypothetical protein GCM10011591_19760 [Nocardia camponoti]
MTATRRPRSPLAALVDERLTGAACAGMAPFFDAEHDEIREDPDDREFRHAAAIRVCGQCRVQVACSDAAAEQDKPQGVWGATVYPAPARPVGRPPRKENAA